MAASWSPTTIRTCAPISEGCSALIGMSIPSEDGNAAIEAIRKNPPDLVVTDAMMPGLDGFGLLAAIRNDPELRDLPVIMLSARAGEEARIEGLEAGADYYLTKPFSARELVAQVNANLTLARVRSEAARDLRAGEEALRRRTTQFETLLNEAPLGVYLVDADFKISGRQSHGIAGVRGYSRPRRTRF